MKQNLFYINKACVSLWVLLVWSPLSLGDEITLAVASNFTKAAQQLAAEFEKISGHKVRLAFGSTGAHYAQISHGAPFDAFFAADVKTPALLERERKIIPGSRVTYAQGQLVLWSPKADFINLKGEVLQQTTFKYLAIANPKLAPYGLAAQQTLEALGILAQVEARLVRGENISQTHQFIASGAAELGFVALAQIITGAIKGSYWLVPQNLYDPIEQQAVLLTDKQAARDFLGFVQSDAGRKIIQAYGYTVVSSPVD